MILLKIYLLGVFVSWLSLLTFKGWKKIDVFDVILFTPILSVGSWFTIIYLVNYIKENKQ